MKKFTIIILAVLLSALISNTSKAQGLTGPYINFSDANFFNALIRAGVDKDGNNKIDTLEADSITNLDITNSNVKNLIGIEYFKNLDKLICFSNDIDSVDVSNNIKLTYLDFTYNNLNKLDVSKNINLIELNCYYNILSNLDVSKNINLTKLNCAYNKITNLDFSKNINLSHLDCYENKLNNLNVSNNVNLTYLNCRTNNLIFLDIHRCNKISDLCINTNYNLQNVCVWILPFPPLSITLLSDNNCSKNLKYDTTCLWLNTKEIIHSKEISIYPNPANDKIFLSNKADIEIIDITGKILIKQLNSNEIDISKLAKGIYFIKIKFDDKIRTEKFIKE
jgi:hypothetical protein